MIVDAVDRVEGYWELRGPLGERLRLPAIQDTVRVDVGTIGTRRRGKVAGSVTGQFAQRLSDLQRPVFLVDIRRSGSGGQGSWGPLELGTIIPGFVQVPYSYYHLPLAAPSVDLLAKWRAAMKLDGGLDASGIREAEQKLLCHAGELTPEAYRHWQVFRAAYLSELSKAAVLAGRAFAEAAVVVGGIAVFLCAEALCPEFDVGIAQEEQDNFYCHRFTFVAQVARSIAEGGNSGIGRLDLAIEQSDVRSALLRLESG